MRAALWETSRLLATHLRPFTPISLTVWLSTHMRLIAFVLLYRRAPETPSQPVASA